MASSKKPANQTPVTPNRGAEVTVIGSYARPKAWGAFGSTAGDKAEITQAEADKWSPTTDYFRIVANTPNKARAGLTEIFDISSVGEWLGAIITGSGKKPRPPKSVARVNIVTHGNPGLIGLSGTVEANGDVFLSTAAHSTQSNPDAPLAGGGLDGTVIDYLNDRARSVRDDVRKALRDDAEMHLILCHGGLGKGLLLMKDLADCFNCTVRGFAEPVVYHITFDATHILDRNSTSIGPTGPQGKGYKCFVKVPDALAGNHLAPNRSASKPSKPTP